MSSRKTQHSTPRKLSSAAKHLVWPTGVVSTGWPAVERKCLDMGLRFRWWQKPIGQLILAKRADGKYASTISGTGLSIPRQVGKTFLVGAIVFALCLLRPKLTVIWTAHRVRTAEETFGKMQAFAKRKRIAPFVSNIVLGSGEQAIEFSNGSRILFGARAAGFGRGFDEVDVLIFDEAQILSEAALEDMVPATNQSRQDTGALLLFMGTPPRPKDPGEVFTRMRVEALSGDDEDTGWVEFGSDDDFNPTALPEPLTERDWIQVAKANISFPDDTPREAVLRMRKKLGTDAFNREGLGKWDNPDEDRAAIDFKTWSALKVSDAAPLTRAQMVIAAAPDGSRATIALATDTGDNEQTLMLVDHSEGTTWAIDKAAVVRSRVKLVEVALTPAAKHLSPGLTRAGVEHKVLSNTETDAGCAALQQWVKDGTVTHLAQAELDAAMKNARARTMTGVQRWDQRDPTVDISPVVAASAAAQRWRTNTAKPDIPPPSPRRARAPRSTPGSLATTGF